MSTRDIEYFLPVSRSPRRWKNGLKVVLEQPLFPSYIFARIDRRERLRVLELPGVLSIVGTGRELTPLPDAEIEALREGIDSLKAEPHPFLNVGERARITRGALQGMTGIIQRKKTGLRLILSVELIMKSISVEIDESALELVESASQAIENVSRSEEYGVLERSPC